MLPPLQLLSYEALCVESLQCLRLAIHTQNIMAEIFIYHLTFCLGTSQITNIGILPTGCAGSAVSLHLLQLHVPDACILIYPG